MNVFKKFPKYITDLRKNYKVKFFKNNYFFYLIAIDIS